MSSQEPVPAKPALSKEDIRYIKESLRFITQDRKTCGLAIRNLAKNPSQQPELNILMGRAEEIRAAAMDIYRKVESVVNADEEVDE